MVLNLHEVTHVNLITESTGILGPIILPIQFTLNPLAGSIFLKTQISVIFDPQLPPQQVLKYTLLGTEGVGQC
jgi:hypothetical protein